MALNRASSADHSELWINRRSSRDRRVQYVALMAGRHHDFRMNSVTLFLDTNGFIQLRDLKDIPWRKLFRGVKHVRIMVARAVVDELDKHKVSNKPRQRDRARAALRQIGEARKAGGVLTL